MTKVLFLCAGYGTRLQRDVAAQGEQYAHLRHLPKALVPIGRKDALLTHWIDLLRRCSLDDLYLISNDLYLEQFIAWAERHDFPRDRITTDGTRDNDRRIGAVGCLQLAVERFGLQQDNLLVIASDTLFSASHLHLPMLLGQFKQVLESAGSLVVYYPCSDAEVSKTGILAVDSASASDGNAGGLVRVVGFIEKPDPQQTPLRNACPCFYLLNRQQWPLLDEFMREKQSAPLSERDATGKYLAWLIHHHSVYAVPIDGRYEVGNLRSYLETHDAFLCSPDELQ